MAELKTKVNDASVDAFLKKNASGEKLKDSYALIEIMKKATKQEPKMWGPSIIGFGSYHYKYESGRKGDMCAVGFSPRKAAFSIYIITGFNRSKDLLEKLGKFKMAKACLYVKRLSDIDEKVLSELIKSSVKYIKSYREYPHRA